MSNIEVRAIRTRWIGGRPELAIISSSVTDTVGRYTLQGLSEGLYYVAAHVPCTLTERTKNGEGTVCWEYSPNSSNAASAVVIAVTAGLAISGVDIRMRALEVFRLHGQVLNYVGTSGPLTIELRPKDDSTGASSLGALAVRTGNEGTFTFDGVAAGLYELGVRGEVKASNLNSEPHLLTTTEINVVHDIDDLKVYAFPLSDVAGQLEIDGFGRIDFDQACVHLVALSTTGMSSSSNSDSNGGFSFVQVDPGDYSLELSGLPSGVYVRSVTLDRQDVADGTIRIGSAGVAQLLLRIRTGTATIGGAVKSDESGSRRSTEAKTVGAVFLISTTRSRAGASRLFAPIEDDGRFSVQDVPPGDYFVFAVDELKDRLELWKDARFLREIQGRSTAITVRENDQQQIRVSMIRDNEIDALLAHLGLRCAGDPRLHILTGSAHRRRAVRRA